MKRLNWKRKKLSKCGFIIVLSLVMISMYSGPASTETPPVVEPMRQDVTQGALRVKIGEEIVECPLKHTDVKVDISGFIARATVTQTFYNPYDENVEAVYVFPLPHTATIDALAMRVGDRKIAGVMKPAHEASGIYNDTYEQVLQRRKIVGLLEQESPNIFTQSVENIKPRQEVHIEISYIDALNYDRGTYEFHFPMVVGPRYIHAPPTSKKPELPDGLRPTQPVLKSDSHTGHDIRLSVLLDAGVPIQDIEIVNHTAALERIGDAKAKAKILPVDSMPNKDFVMKYTVVGEKPEMAVFAHAPNPDQGHFMLMIQPKLDAEPPKVTPREFVFLIDVSDSMPDESMAMLKAMMHHFFAFSRPSDTLQLITFVWDTEDYDTPFKKISQPPPRILSLFENPAPAIVKNIGRARTFIQQTQDDYVEGLRGCTVIAANVIKAPVDPKRVRIVVLFTDDVHPRPPSDYLEDFKLKEHVDDARRFWFIGFDPMQGVLIEGIPKPGDRISRVLDLNTNPEPLVRQIVEHIPRAQLTHIQMDWNHLPIYETYPRQLPDLWTGRPVILFGRYTAGGSAKIEVSGVTEGKSIAYSYNVTLPDAAPTHEVLAKIWAKKKIADLSGQMSDVDRPEVEEECTRIARDYGLLSEYTRLVAVDESGMPYGGPVEMLSASFNPWGIWDKKDNLPHEFIETQSATWTGAFRSHSIFAEYYSPLLNTLAKAAVADAQILRQAEHLEESRVRYQHAYRLLNRPISYNLIWDWDLDSDMLKTANQGMDSLRNEIGKKRLEASPSLNQKLNLVLWTQPFANALRTIVNAGGFQLNLVPESLNDIAPLWNGADPRVGYLDLRQATIAQALDRLCGVHLIWQITSGDTITIGTPPRTQGTSTWSYNVEGLTIPLGDEWELYRSKEGKQLLLDSKAWTLKPDVHARVPKGNFLSNLIRKIKQIFTGSKPSEPVLVAQPRFQGAEGRLLSAMISFEYAVNTLLDASDDAVPAVFTSPTHLLVYGDPAVHKKIRLLLAALRDSDIDVANLFGHELSDAELTYLKALQKLTTARWEIFAGPSIVPDLTTPSWELLAAALKGEVDLEALKKLQIAWKDPRMNALIEGEYLLVAMRSMWCIHTAAQIVPTDDELSALSQSVLSKVKRMRTLKPREGSHMDYLGALYAVLALQDGGPSAARKTLMERVEKGIYDDKSSTARLIAEVLLSPSEKSDKALQSLLPLDSYWKDDDWGYDGDLILLTCLAAKRRGGDLWRTFYEELPNTMRGKHRASGQVAVILNRLAASRKHI